MEDARRGFGSQSKGFGSAAFRHSRGLDPEGVQGDDWHTALLAGAAWWRATTRLGRDDPCE